MASKNIDKQRVISIHRQPPRRNSPILSFFDHRGEHTARSRSVLLAEIAYPCGRSCCQLGHCWAGLLATPLGAPASRNTAMQLAHEQASGKALDGLGSAPRSFLSPDLDKLFRSNI